MQRIYDVPKHKKPDTTEFFELRENSPQENLMEMKPAYKIPSSSNLLQNSGLNKTYKPATQAYPQPENHPQPQSQHTPYVSPRSLHCIVIADHIMDCPICSRLYRNYTPFYNILLMILFMLLVFLFIRCQKLSMGIPHHKPVVHSE
jgi:hypothetical protein